MVLRCGYYSEAKRQSCDLPKGHKQRHFKECNCNFGHKEDCPSSTRWTAKDQARWEHNKQWGRR